MEMNRNTFENQMDRLSETFGRSAYGNERILLLWAAVRALSDEWMTKAVDNFILSNRQAPLWKEFEEAVHAERERLRKSKQHEEEIIEWDKKNYSCEFCKDSGVYLCINKTKPEHGFWAFRCSCVNGIACTRGAIPFYKKIHQDEGFVYNERKFY